MCKLLHTMLRTYAGGPVVCFIRSGSAHAGVALLMALSPLCGRAQVIFTGTYTQTFDGMGTGSTIPPGWSHIGRLGGSATSWGTSIPASGSPSAASAGTVNNSLITASNIFTGTSNTRAFNYSGSNTADRALGTSPTSGAGNILQLVLANGIGGPVSTVQVAYNIRRFANATSPETIPGYRLFVSVNGGSTWSPVAALDPTSITLPNTVGTSTFSQSVTLPAAVPAGGQLRLRWVDDNSASSSVDQRIGLDNVSITAASPPTCGIPGGPAVTSITSSGALLSWQAVPGAVSYNVRWRPLSATTFTNVTGIATTSYALTGLQATTAHEFQVQAVCAGGAGSFTAPVAFITGAANPACAAATNLAVANITATSAQLSWSAPGANLFNIFWKPVSATNFFIQSNVQGFSWTLSGLSPSTPYVFQVQAVCGGSDEDPSIPAELSLPAFFTTAPTQQAPLAPMAFAGGPDLAIWPNPSHGGRMDVRLGKLDGSLTTATLDVHDLFGKRLASHTLPVADGLLGTHLDLPGDLAHGLYLVTVTAGAQQFTQRLVVK